MVKLFLVLAGFFMSSELVWSMAASGLLKSILGVNYAFAQPQFIFLVTIISCFLIAGLHIKNGPFIVCTAFLSVGLYEYFATCLGDGHSGYAFQQFIFGFLYPVLLVFALAGMTIEKRLLFFRWFYIGYCAYLLVALFLLFVIDDIFIRQFDTYGLGGALISMRFQETDENLFSLILGNANKQSNNLIMSILLGPYLIGIAGEGKGCANRDLVIFRLFVMLATLVLVVLFSRAAMFLLPIALYLNRHHLFRVSRRFLFLCLAGIVWLSIEFFDVFAVAANYLLFAEYFDSTPQGFVGTFSERIDQWSTIGPLLSGPEFFLRGLGVGTYGLLRAGSEQAGTHNLFLDHLLASGLYGVIVLSFIVASGMVQSLIKRDLRLVAGYFFFVALSFREYSFSYLYVTSMGGFFFVLLAFLAFDDSLKKVIQVNSSIRSYRLSSRIVPLILGRQFRGS